MNFSSGLKLVKQAWLGIPKMVAKVLLVGC